MQNTEGISSTETDMLQDSKPISDIEEIGKANGKTSMTGRQFSKRTWCNMESNDAIERQL